jgi:hypothetical protein
MHTSFILCIGEDNFQKLQIGRAGVMYIVSIRLVQKRVQVASPTRPRKYKYFLVIRIKITTSETSTGISTKYCNHIFSSRKI